MRLLWLGPHDERGGHRGGVRAGASIRSAGANEVRAVRGEGGEDSSVVAGLRGRAQPVAGQN
jgi:hypothetical protein